MIAAELMEQVMYGKHLSGKTAGMLSLQFFNPRRQVWESFEDLHEDNQFEFVLWEARVGHDPFSAYEPRYGGHHPDPYYGYKPSLWNRAKNWLKKNSWIIPLLAATAGAGAIAHREYMKKYDPDYARAKNKDIALMMKWLEAIFRKAKDENEAEDLFYQMPKKFQDLAVDFLSFVRQSRK